MIDEKEVAIIGMGPGGVSAAIYLSRYGMKPVCFEKDLIGGKTNYTEKIANYAGYLDEKGPQLGLNFSQQLDRFAIKTIYKEVKSVMPNPDGTFDISYGKEVHTFRYVILANGLGEKTYDVKGSDKFSKRGISRCAICDGAFYKGKNVAVLGGGNSAVEEAAYLASICPNVYLISHSVPFKAEQAVMEEFTSHSSAHIYAPYDIKESRGDKILEGLTLVNLEDKTEVDIDINGLFIYIGSIPVNQFLLVKDVLDEHGFVVTDEKMKSKVDGLYAIGDCRKTPLRQVATAVSDGAIAANSIHTDYLKNRR